jgi:hypothetical protein
VCRLKPAGRKLFIITYLRTLPVSRGSSIDESELLQDRTCLLQSKANCEMPGIHGYLVHHTPFFIYKRHSHFSSLRVVGFIIITTVLHTLRYTLSTWVTHSLRGLHTLYVGYIMGSTHAEMQKLKKCSRYLGQGSGAGQSSSAMLLE